MFLTNFRILFFILFFSVYAKAQKLPVLTISKYGTSAVKGYFFLTANENLILMDKDANIVYYKPLLLAKNFTLEKNGKMYFSDFSNLYLMDSTFQIIDTFSCKNGVHSDMHDVIILSNNNVILLGNEKAMVDVSNNYDWKKKWGRDTLKISASVIQEQDEHHNVIMEWHSKAYFPLIEADTFFVNRDPSPEAMHCNALDLDFDGNILLSSRNFNEIIKINRKDGSIIWQLGGKHNEFKFVNCPTPFYGQHNIRILRNGHLTLFDNGDYTPPHGARAMEFEIDEKNKIAKLEWSYMFDKDITSRRQGNVQRLSDGNTLINLGGPSISCVWFVIVDSSGKKLFQVNGPDNGNKTILPKDFNPYRILN